MSIFNFIIYGTVSIVSKIFVYIFKSLTYQGCVYLFFFFFRRFYPKRLTIAVRLYIFISMCSLGIEPTTFCAADAMLYHWATQEHIGLLRTYYWFIWPITVQKVLLQFKITVFYFTFSIFFYYFFYVIYYCDGKAEFSEAITPVFSVTWCFRNHSDLMLK